MPKLNAWQSAAASIVSTGLAIGVALGLVKNQTAQLVIALVPSLIVNLTILGISIVNAIDRHTAAVVALASNAGTSRLVVGRKRYKTGRLPAVWPAGLKAFAEYLTVALATPPLTVAVPHASYPMDGNDTYGDCTIAGVDHLIRAFNKLYGSLGKALATLKQLIAEYFDQTGGGDTGLVEAYVLAKWHKAGLFGHKIAGYAPIKPTDIVGIKQAVAFYGGCYLGIQCPESCQDQFSQQEETGKQVPWTYVPGSPIEGGHCIVALGYTADGLLCASWGGIVLVTWAFLAHYLDEAWVVLPDELVAKKKDTLGVALATLQADLAQL